MTTKDMELNNKLNIIFLDVDGVLHPYNSKTETFVEEQMIELQKILYATDAKVVITSNWRYNDMEELRMGLASYGIEIFDSTPNLVGISLEVKKEEKEKKRLRQSEIDNWLEANAEIVDNYVIIDDDPYNEITETARFVKTDSEIGLTEEETAIVIKLFQKRVIGFWGVAGSHGYFSQFKNSEFIVSIEILDALPIEIKRLKYYQREYDNLEKMIYNQNGIGVFSCAEKWMMMSKAALFEDDKIFKSMQNQNVPKNLKALGRKVSGFKPKVWNKYCRDVVIIGNYLKFSQNEDLKKKLLDTGSTIIAEASPSDAIWGIGLRPEDPRVSNPSQWKGTNYLGSCLMFVRNVVNGESE